MNVVAVALAFLIVTVTQTLAAGGSNGEKGLSLSATFFTALCVLIVLFQLVPGIRLFVGMLKGLFSRADTSHETVDRHS